MTDLSEKSNSLNSDKISVETRISNNNYQKNSGDGPQISVPFCDLSFSLEELNSGDKQIKPIRIESDPKSFNEFDKTSIPAYEHCDVQAKHEDNDKLSLKDGGSNKTFSLTSWNNTAILDIFKNIQTTINQLKSSNVTAKNQISKDLDQIGSYMLTCEYNRQIKLNGYFKYTINDAEIQRLQMLLLYILEQLNHLNGTIIDAETQIDKLFVFKMEEIEIRTINDKNKSEIENSNEKILVKEVEEEDIFSVEELSWDEHQLSIQKLDKQNVENTSDQCNKVNTENFPIKLQLNATHDSSIRLLCSPKADKIITSFDNCIDENSTKSPNSKLSPQLTDSVVIEKFNEENLEKSTSFQEIKNKFEKLKNYSPNLSEKKDETLSKSTKTDKHNSNTKKSSLKIYKSNKSDKENGNFSKKLEDDYIDNSAFLVSSIDSFTESISFTNPNNNNNRFSDKYKTNIINIIDNKKFNQSVDIDLIAEKCNLFSESTRDVNKLNSCLSINKPDQYIEVVNNVILPNEPIYVDTPYVNYQNENESKSSNSSSEHIIAMGRLITRFQKIIQKENQIDQEYSPIYRYMKEIIDTEKNYVNGLFIYSQILYNRIKLSNIISHRNLNAIFPNCIHQIYQFHVEFCNQLNGVFQKTLSLELLRNSNTEKFEESKTQTVKFGQIFLENLENDNWKFFTLYRQFYSKSQSAISIFYKLKKNSPKFERLIKILQHNEHCNNQDLGSFIKLPVQRISAYLVMLRMILNKLNGNQLDEKIPILAIEHLLHCFLKEMNSKFHFGNKKNQSNIAQTSPDLSASSLKCTSLYEAPVNELNCKSRIYHDKSENAIKMINSTPIKKFWSQSVMMNDFIKDSNQNLNSDSQDDSMSTGPESKKESFLSRNSSDKKNNLNYKKNNFISQLKSLENRKLEFKELNYEKDTKFKKEYTSNFKLFTVNQKINTTNYDIIRPQSVPLQEKSQKTKKSQPIHGGQYDTESLNLQTTDECSVCLNSQEEFEIDTSIEDDKTCTAESNGKFIEKFHSNKSSRLDSSLSPQNSTNCQLIEFCSESQIKYNNSYSTSVEDEKRNSIKWLLSGQNTFAILNSLLCSETDSLINKKVENMVMIICHILTETIQHEYLCSQSSIKTINNDKNLLSAIYNEPLTSDCCEPSIDISNYFEDKKGRKFSIKHLFSLKRKSRIDKTSQLDYLNKNQSVDQTVKRSTSRSSLQKRLSNTTLKIIDKLN